MVKSKKETKKTKEPDGLETLRKELWMDSLPDKLPFRDEELDKIYEFCQLFIERKDESYSLYLGGVPGTGKTSCVLQTINELKEELKSKFQFIHLNGGEMVRPEDLYIKFYQAYTRKEEKITANNAYQKLNTIFNNSDSKRLPIIVLIDELDFLVNRNQTVIYNMFNFASSPGARLAIISITNTFDFTSRVLDSRIQSRIGTNRMHFQPYNWTQIEEILKNRLETSKNLVDKSALQFAARKVANMSGDIRKALDILRRAIDIAINNQCPKLSMKEIDEACKESKNTYRMCLVRSMGLHELRLFRALYDDLHQDSVNETLFGYVYRRYERLCTEDGVKALDFDDVLKLVLDGVDFGFYKLSKAPGSFNRKVSLAIDMYEAKFCLDKADEGSEN